MFRRVRGFAPILIVASTLLITAPLPAQEPSAEEQAAMAAMMAAGQPGEHHKHMAYMEGTWDVVTRFWMPGAAEPMESKGTSTIKWILGGRYLQQSFSGEAMGMPFEGLGTMGYDNVAKKYFSTWTDSMSTSMMTEFGQCDEAGKKVHWKGEMADPMSGVMMSTRTEQVMDSNDKFTMTAYATGPDGKEMKTMELVFTRKG